MTEKFQPQAARDPNHLLHRSGRMMTPKRAGWLWLAGNLGLLMIAPAYAFWLIRIYNTGGLRFPAMGDSLGLPIFGLAALVILVLPIFNIGFYFLLRHYPGRVAVFRRPKSRGWGLFVDLAYGTIEIVLAYLVAAAAWYGDWELSALGLYWIGMMFCFRAVSQAKLEQRDDRSTARQWTKGE